MSSVPVSGGRRLVVHLGVVGAACALAVAVPLAAVPSIVWGIHVLWAGVPSVLVLGLALGSTSIRRPATAAVTMMLGAVALSDAVILVVLSALDGGADPADLAVLWVYGMAIFGLPALLITGPAAVAWLYLVRRFADVPADQGGADGYGARATAASTAANRGWDGSMSTAQDASDTGPAGVANV